MESATTHDSSDSMAARMAMVMPLASSSRNRSRLSWGKLQRRQARLDGVQVADGVDLQAERGHHGGAHDNGHQRTGDALGHLRPQHQDGQAHHAHQHSLPVHRGDVSRQSAQLSVVSMVVVPAGYVSPSKSLIWPTKMVTAIPAVKPVVMV